MWKRRVPQKTKKNTIPREFLNLSHRLDVTYFLIYFLPLCRYLTDRQTGIFQINYFHGSDISSIKLVQLHRNKFTQCEVKIEVPKIIFTSLLILEFIFIIIYEWYVYVAIYNDHRTMVLFKTEYLYLPELGLTSRTTFLSSWKPLPFMALFVSSRPFLLPVSFSLSQENCFSHDEQFCAMSCSFKIHLGLLSVFI